MMTPYPLSLAVQFLKRAEEDQVEQEIIIRANLYKIYVFCIYTSTKQYALVCISIYVYVPDHPCTVCTYHQNQTYQSSLPRG